MVFFLKHWTNKNENFQFKEIAIVSYESGYDKKILWESREDKNEREQVTKYKFGFDLRPAPNSFFKHIS